MVSTINTLLLAGGVGVLGGAINGLAVAYLRLQPIVTTYATSFIFSGVALLVLPRPGGSLPRDLVTFYRSTPLDIPLAFYVITILVVFWLLLRSTRYGQYLFAIGVNRTVARFSGVRVQLIVVITYTLSGLLAGFGGFILLGFSQTVFLQLGTTYLFRHKVESLTRSMLLFCPSGL